MTTTFLCRYFTFDSKESSGTSTMHGFLLLMPKIIVSQDGQSIILDAQFTSPSIAAFQIAIGYLALDIFAMRTIKACTAIAKVCFVLGRARQTTVVIDTKFVRVVVTQSNRFMFTMFTNIELTIGILGIVAIAKVLIISVDVIETRNALATMKAFVSIVGWSSSIGIARLVGAVASENI